MGMWFFLALFYSHLYPQRRSGKQRPRSRETKRDKGLGARLESIAASGIALADAHFGTR